MEEKLTMQSVIYIAAVALVTAMTLGGAYLMYYGQHGLVA